MSEKRCGQAHAARPPPRPRPPLLQHTLGVGRSSPKGVNLVLYPAQTWLLEHCGRAPVTIVGRDPVGYLAIVEWASVAEVCIVAGRAPPLLLRGRGRHFVSDSTSGLPVTERSRRTTCRQSGLHSVDGGLPEGPFGRRGAAPSGAFFCPAVPQKARPDGAPRERVGADLKIPLRPAEGSPPFLCPTTLGFHDASYRAAPRRAALPSLSPRSSALPSFSSSPRCHIPL